MEKFTITVDKKIFTFEKTINGYYKIIPFDDNITVEMLSNALISQKKHFISGFGSYNPIPIEELNEDGEKPCPFDIKERCFLAFIEISKECEIKKLYRNFTNNNEENN